MATFTLIPDFLEALFEGEINVIAASAVEMLLSATAPGSEGSPTTTSGNGIGANKAGNRWQNMHLSPRVNVQSQFAGGYAQCPVHYPYIRSQGDMSRVQPKQ